MSVSVNNPIFDYAAEGQSFEKSEDWEKAVYWYQRALACLPFQYRIESIENDILRHPVAGKKTVPIEPRHASGIYAALAYCLFMLHRFDDSLLAVKAACDLDPENISAQRLFQDPAFGEIREGKGRRDTDAGFKNGAMQKCDLGSSLTLIFVTHCTRPLKKFSALSPPSSKLLTATYGSLIQMFGERIGQCPKIICYDQKPTPAQRDAQYGASLEHFSRQHGFALHVFQAAGLFNILNRIVQTVKTPYLFFVEHDWLFRGDCIDIGMIVAAMNNHSHINSVRFNKRPNYLDGTDFIMNVHALAKGCPLLRTASYSNNPSILRTAKIRNEWLPECERALQPVIKNLGGTAFGVEEILFKLFVRDIRNHGFEDAHEKWGTCIYGRVGDAQRIVHLGE